MRKVNQIEICRDDMLKRIIKFISKHKLLITVIIEIIVILVLYFLGFRITYNAKIENNWDAIEACGTWFCGCIVPIAVIVIQHKISESEQRTSASNTALLDEIEQIKNSVDSTDPQRQVKRHISSDEIYRFICIKMVASTEEIAEHFKVDINDIKHQLEDLWAVSELISTVSLEDNPNGNIAKCHWKKS